MKFFLALVFFGMVFLFGCVQTTQNDSVMQDSQGDKMQGDSMVSDSMGDSMGDSMIGDDIGMDDSVNHGDSMGDGDSKQTDAMNDSMADAPKSSTAFGPTYERYTKAAFDEARAEGRPIFLGFYANWCPTCQAQMPVTAEAFKSMDMPENVAGFVVHYNDAETNAEDNDAARTFGIAYQHTHIFLSHSGAVVKKTTGHLSEADIIAFAKQAESV